MIINYYPTIEHKDAANKFIEIFCNDSRINSILLIGSCSRGQASKDSCLDLGVIITDWKYYEEIENEIEKLKSSVEEFINLESVGIYSSIHPSITTGIIKLKSRTWTSGPDSFELEIGNFFIYSVILYDKNDFIKRIIKNYLPYYSEELRKHRLSEVKKYCMNNLDHINLYMKRGLWFQSYDRLYNAIQEFIQGLFIKNKKYPIAYDKWIKYQFSEILKMPEIYKEIVELFKIENIESDELIKKQKY